MSDSYAAGGSAPDRYPGQMPNKKRRVLSVAARRSRLSTDSAGGEAGRRTIASTAVRRCASSSSSHTAAALAAALAAARAVARSTALSERSSAKAARGSAVLVSLADRRRARAARLAALPLVEEACCGIGANARDQCHASMHHRALCEIVGIIITKQTYIR